MIEHGSQIVLCKRVPQTEHGDLRAGELEGRCPRSGRELGADVTLAFGCRCFTA